MGMNSLACEAGAESGEIGGKLEECLPPSSRNLKHAHLLMMSNLSTTDQSQRILLLGRRESYTFRRRMCLQKQYPLSINYNHLNQPMGFFRSLQMKKNRKYRRMTAGALSISPLKPENAGYEQLYILYIPSNMKQNTGIQVPPMVAVKEVTVVLYYIPYFCQRSNLTMF